MNTDSSFYRAADDGQVHSGDMSKTASSGNDSFAMSSSITHSCKICQGLIQHPERVESGPPPSRKEYFLSVPVSHSDWATAVTSCETCRMLWQVIDKTLGDYKWNCETAAVVTKAPQEGGPLRVDLMPYFSDVWPYRKMELQLYVHPGKFIRPDRSLSADAFNLILY